MTLEIGPRQTTPVEVRYNVSPVELAPVSSRGPTGLTGPRGSVIYQGATEPPVSNLGVDGDWYFTNAQGTYTTRIYRKTSGQWIFFAQPQGFNYRGNYLDYIDYVVGDMVTYNGSSYIVTVDPPVGVEPTDDQYWQVFAAAGEDGEDGAQGPEGPPGSGIESYVELNDTPGAFAGDELKLVRVNAAGTALEHVFLSSMTFPWGQLSGVPASFPPAGHFHVADDVTDFDSVVIGLIETSDIEDLSNVLADSPSSGNILKFNGSLWDAGFVDWSELTGKPADFTPNEEDVEDIIFGLLTSGPKIGLNYDDGSNTLEISTSALSAEEVRDTVASFIIEGTSISVTHDDGANTFTISVNAADFAAAIHNHSASQITSGILSVGRGGTGNNSVPSVSNYTGGASFGAHLQGIDTALGGKASTSHNHSASDITSGAFDDARISESSVTQHQEALSIGVANFDADTAQSFSLLNGSSLDTVDVSVSSNGTTITLSIEKTGGGDCRFFFSDGVHSHDCTPADTISLTAGTDESPVLNYVYILQSSKALTVSTVGFPEGEEYAAVAEVLCQSAASAQTDGLYKVHVWTDHVSGDVGHLAHINHWIRDQHASWESGALCTPSAGVSTFDVSVSSGVVLQLHEHDFPAFDTSSGSEIVVPNDSVTSYSRAGDLTGLLVDADGESLSGKYFNLVVWGVVSEDEADCQLMVNLPSGSYNQTGPAQIDANATAIYTIPSEFRGTGFLIARLTVRHTTAGGGTWTIEKNTDLRGLTPATGAGGGATGASQLNELTDVILTSPDVGHVMIHNGTSWVNSLRTERLATYNKADTGTEDAVNIAMPFAGNITELSFALTASDTGEATVRVRNAAGTATSVGTATISSAITASVSVSWSTGSGSFSSGDRIEIEPTSGFSSAGAKSTISAVGTRSN